MQGTDSNSLSDDIKLRGRYAVIDKVWKVSRSARRTGLKGDDCQLVQVIRCRTGNQWSWRRNSVELAELKTWQIDLADPQRSVSPAVCRGRSIMFRAVVTDEECGICMLQNVNVSACSLADCLEAKSTINRTISFEIPFIKISYRKGHAAVQIVMWISLCRTTLCRFEGWVSDVTSVRGFRFRWSVAIYWTTHNPTIRFRPSSSSVASTERLSAVIEWTRQVRWYIPAVWQVWAPPPAKRHVTAPVRDLVSQSRSPLWTHAPVPSALSRCPPVSWCGGFSPLVGAPVVPPDAAAVMHAQLTITFYCCFRMLFAILHTNIPNSNISAATTTYSLLSLRTMAPTQHLWPSSSS